MAPTKRVSFLPPFMVFALVSSMYVVFLLMHLLPQFRRLNWLQPSEKALPPSLPNDPHMYPAPASEVVGLALGFHVAFVFFLASFFQAMATPPGAVPAGDPQWERGQFEIEPREDREVERIIRDVNTDLSQPGVRSLLKRMPIVERKKGKPASLDSNGHNPDEEASLIDSDDLKRKCHGCMVYKPDRVHHCQVCGSCVLRMDHHCPWVANCVGFRNYKYFLLALFYAIVSMILMIASMLPRFSKVFAPVLDTNYFLRRDLPIAIVFGTACLLLIVIGCFFCFHLYLTTHAMSTIEYREKKNHEDAEVKHRWAVAHIKYDRGSAYENFKHVMGEPYMWLFPVDPRPEDDGTYAKVQPEQQSSSKIL